MIYKMTSIILMFLWEFLIIYAENYAAKYSSISWSVEQWVLIVTLVVVSGLMLVFAYKTWYQAFENIRVVVAISVGSIVIVEPLVSRYMFQEIPHIGALIGCGLCVMWMLVATLWK
jgi:hypothetical protein